MNQIDSLRKKIQPLREKLINHKVYKNIKNIEHIRLFMESHIFAVWDFMSLLKCLQISLTCVRLPWVPVGTAETRYLINEIVIGEESDVDQQGNKVSHFELYLESMKQCGANTTHINSLVEKVNSGIDVFEAIAQLDISVAAKEFMINTFNIAYSNKLHIQSAAFTFGREDLIPGMFISLVGDIHKTFPEEMSILKYYLERHIEVDSGEHNPLAIRMTEELCGNDDQKWQEAEEAVIKCLEARINLWNQINLEIENKLALTSV